jgi:hypothetical protein
LSFAFGVFNLVAAQAVAELLSFGGTVVRALPITVLLALAAGCATSGHRPEASGQSAPTAHVTIFQSGTQNFYLKGDYGIVMQRDGGSGPDRRLRYELFSRDRGRLIMTESKTDFLSELDRLPQKERVDFYDTCTISLCLGSPDAQSVLTHCDRRGIAGNYYIMCTDIGTVGGKRTWKWKDRAEQ